MIWARWSEALAEAGFVANKLQGRFDDADVLLRVVELSREIGRLPTQAEMKLCRRTRPSFPSPGAIANRFPAKADLIAAFRKLVAAGGYDDLLAMLPIESAPQERVPALAEGSPSKGFVYLLRSGEYYKVGRSENVERRIREVRTALPDAVTLVHSINTDDPSGIEAFGTAVSRTSGPTENGSACRSRMCELSSGEHSSNHPLRKQPFAVVGRHRVR